MGYPTWPPVETDPQSSGSHCQALHSLISVKRSSVIKYGVAGEGALSTKPRITQLVDQNVFHESGEQCPLIGMLLNVEGARLLKATVEIKKLHFSPCNKYLQNRIQLL